MTMAPGLQVIDELSQPAQQRTVLEPQEASSDRSVFNRHAFAIVEP